MLSGDYYCDTNLPVGDKLFQVQRYDKLEGSFDNCQLCLLCARDEKYRQTFHFASFSIPTLLYRLSLAVATVYLFILRAVLLRAKRSILKPDNKQITNDIKTANKSKVLGLDSR